MIQISLIISKGNRESISECSKPSFHLDNSNQVNDYSLLKTTGKFFSFPVLFRTGI